jgi:hypothetical protein
MSIFTKAQKKQLYDAGYSRGQVSEWDRLKCRPRPERAVRVAKLTGVSVRRLLGIPLEKEGDAA